MYQRFVLHSLLGLTVLLLAACTSPSATSPAPSIAQTVSFQTADSIWVFADLFPAQGVTDVKAAPVLLLLHQSASNSEEYGPVIPKLTALGFTCLAVDARGGGHNYGRENRTNANLPHHGGGKEAFWDFKAAIAYLQAEGFTGNYTMWGSSYSAGRMFMVLAEKPEQVVAGVSLSPGRGFVQRGPNGEPSWAEQVDIPIFMSWSPDELNEDTRARFDKVASTTKVLYEQTAGVHASATVRPDRNPEGHAANFEAVVAFLEQYAR